MFCSITFIHVELTSLNHRYCVRVKHTFHRRFILTAAAFYSRRLLFPENKRCLLIQFLFYIYTCCSFFFIYIKVKLPLNLSETKYWFVIRGGCTIERTFCMYYLYLGESFELKEAILNFICETWRQYWREERNYTATR